MKKNMMKIRQTLKVHISVMAGKIQLKFGIGGTLSRGSFHRKLVNFRSGTIEL